MPTFDGDALTITLDSGVTEVDVREDIYEAWKTWMLSGNMRYPAAFRVIGGDPLSSIINAGSYFFLRNDYGWRIKPPEENITIYLTGNLAVEDTTLDALIPTTGAFTAAILGLQPVTQGVTESMASQLAFNTFQGHVAVNGDTGYAGTGEVNGTPIGTLKYPAKFMVDALAIAVREGLGDITFHSNMILTGLDFASGYNFAASSPTKLITVNASADVTGCSFKDMRLIGPLDGFNLAERASLEGCTDMSGFGFYVSFKGANAINGDMELIECMSGETGNGRPSFDVGSNCLQTMKWSKSIEIKGALTGSNNSIELQGGRIFIDSTCIGGEIHVRGTPYDIIDNSGAGCDVYIETESKKINDIHGQVPRSVHIDEEKVDTGNGYQQSPYNTWTAGVDYAEDNNLQRLILSADGTVDRQLKNFTIDGLGLPAIDLNDKIMDNTIIRLCEITGGYTGTLNAIECALNNVSGLNGVFFTVNAIGTLTVAPTGNATIWNVKPAIAGQSWTLSMNSGVAASAAVHGSSGEVVITDMDHADDLMHFHGDNGSVTIDATCVAGVIEIYGGVIVIDNSGVGCNVVLHNDDPDAARDDWQFKGLDPANPIVRSGDGVTSEVLTVDSKVLTITPTDITRT